MTDHLQIGTHPDADQISTFLEGRAADHERAQMLAHLATCGTCRDLVFLATDAEASETAPPAVVHEPRRWWLPLGFAGAAVACALLVLALYPRHPAGPRPAQVAQVEPPAAVAPAAPIQSANKPQPLLESKKPGVSADLAAPRKLEGRASGGGLGTGFIEGAIGGLPAPQPPPPSPEIAGRNFDALEPAPAEATAQRQKLAAPRPMAPPAAPAPESAPEQNATANFANQSQQNIGGPLANSQALNALPPLRIEHNRGPADGFSQLTGVVTDMSGAAISQATVVLASADGTSVKRVATGPDGRFTVPSVPPGAYELRVSARGFMQNSEQLDLKPRDLALVNSVLQVGAASQTVTVTAAASDVQTTQQEVSANISPAPPAISPHPSRVEIGNLILRLDSAGALLLSKNSGKTWKKIHPIWKGKAMQLEAAPTPSISAQFFQLTTDSGQVWTSTDGAHWNPR